MRLLTHLKVLGAIAIFIGAIVLGVTALPVFLAIIALLFVGVVYAWLYLIFSD